MTAKGGQWRTRTARRRTAGLYMAPGAEEEEEALGDTGVHAEYTAGQPYAMGGVAGRASYTSGLHHESLREEGDDVHRFTPLHSHALLVEVYCDHLHHKNGKRLNREVVGNDIWQWHWRRLAAQPDICYTTLSADVSRSFTA